MSEESLRHNLASPWEQPELAESLATRPGVGKARLLALAQKGMFTLGDVLWWLPIGYENRALLRDIAFLREKEFAMLELLLEKTHAWGPGGRAWRMEFSDNDNNRILAIWFRFNRAYINGFEAGQSYLLAGEAGKDKEGKWCMIHPRLYPAKDKEQAGVNRIWPVYPPIDGMAPASLRSLIADVVAKFAPLAPDMLHGRLPADIYPLPLGQALQALHLPDMHDADVFAKAKQSLVADELFYFELALSLRRDGRASQHARPLNISNDALQKFSALLPYRLTAGQEGALASIFRDLSQPKPMARLLCGDVGTGKTVVALGAVALTAGAGGKCVFMAPTEILARQHWQNAKTLLQPLGVKVSLLLGGNKSEGEPVERAGLIIGTQALLWRKSDLSEPSLVIIDEQHRFGVGQRFSLTGHGPEPHVLVLSATPIPRSLALALSGYMDISDLPKRANQHRKIETFLATYQEREMPLDALRGCLQQGRQAYVVCAHLDKSQSSNNWDAISTHKRLSKYFAPLKVGLLHGQMKSPEQEEALNDFKSGKVKLLVATTVIEVGVDVAEATLMLILSAERFGLSQLHQLRGRVGRGTHPGQCWLMAGENAPELSLERLKKLCETNDGLAIAEADLALRGPGETLGYKQSGLPPFRIANWVRDAPLASQLRGIIKNLDKNSAQYMALKQEAQRRHGKRLGLIHSG